MIDTIPALSELMFEEIKGDFSSLWATNRLGDTLEIVTPYTDCSEWELYCVRRRPHRVGCN